MELTKREEVLLTVAAKHYVIKLQDFQKSCKEILESPNTSKQGKQEEIERIKEFTKDIEVLESAIEKLRENKKRPFQTA